MEARDRPEEAIDVEYSEGVGAIVFVFESLRWIDRRAIGVASMGVRAHTAREVHSQHFIDLIFHELMRCLPPCQPATSLGACTVSS